MGMNEQRVVFLSEAERYIDATEAAWRFSFPSPGAVLKAFRRGTIPGYKLSPRRVRFKLSELKEWAEGKRAS
jgi:hypothetical protein